jgi:two-component system response regulator HydG
MIPEALVVDDDDGVRFTIRNLLEDAGLTVREARDGQAALDELAVHGPAHVVITDLRMPRMDGMALLRALRAQPNPPRVILMTAHGDERVAVEAMKSGAWDYFRKPFDIDELVAVVERAVETVRLQSDNERLQGELNLSRSMVFRSAAMSRLAVLVQRVAPRDVTVLITGESGTGKEGLAEAIVRASTRSEAPFVRFNCASLSPELAEAELFGHAKGAFTGAVGSRTGLFREADGGTILLDEVGELQPSVQARLLRVLQSGEVRPVGSDHATKVDVRVIAATHRDLLQMSADGTFREDLYYRLKVVHLHVPALRERPDDIALLARHFIERSARRFGTGALRVDPSLIDLLVAQPWPGNVRELENAVEMLVALSHEGELDPGLLPGVEASSTGLGLRERMNAYERGAIVEALAASRGNKTAAARALGISRVSLYEKLEKHGIEG